MYVLYDEFQAVLFEGSYEDCLKKKEEYTKIENDYNSVLGNYYIEKLIDFIGDLPKWGDWL